MIAFSIPSHYKAERLKKRSSIHSVLAIIGSGCLLAGFPGALFYKAYMKIVHNQVAAVTEIFFFLLAGLVFFGLFLLIPFRCKKCHRFLKKSVIAEEKDGTSYRGFIFVCNNCQKFERELYRELND